MASIAAPQLEDAAQNCDCRFVYRLCAFRYAMMEK